MPELDERRQFLNGAALFEGGLALVAFGLGWLVDVDPLASFRMSGAAVGWGTLAAVPMFLLFWIAMKRPVGSFRGIRDFLVQWLGPYLEDCRWYDLAALAAIAGVSEELLFRGVAQPWMEGWGPIVALVGSNLIFGLAHAVTPTYAVIATGMGIYLGWLLTASGERNLLVPITTHAVYDWLAFLYVVHVYRGERPEDEEQKSEARNPKQIPSTNDRNVGNGEGC